ncbi:DEAD-box ATP-dependent RNA helicase 7 [Striga hermonthica]|uniref:RNA helicase n=1 Tax=Striga hermonthica TaxID=68872 RepID=A0A9N7RLC2_STRHE|nr:DEAD-box ATP-dependent RNA helicase 7 [Striga hermonthica]
MHYPVLEESQSSEDNKRVKKATQFAEMEVDAKKKIKKEKKSSKKTNLASEPDPDDSNSNPNPKKWKGKKRKALEFCGGEDGGDEEKSETSSEQMKHSGKKKKKTMKLEENGVVDEKEENPIAVLNFRISKPLRDALKAKRIESLFPIQAMTFDLILDGSDLVGRARTGRTGYGRPPIVLVLLPTRELAIQDHLQDGRIDFRALKFRVLDEADEMLRMGFVEDVEFILGKVEDASKVQTLLFSATLPPWVKQISAKFLNRTRTADLVGNDKMKASTSVRHLVLPCSVSARSQLISDIIRCYGFSVCGGRTIIFTKTRNSASTLAGVLPGARALHGDIQQTTPEVTLAGFRSGKFFTLVATNVEARGLDIDDMQLIIQCEPPRDVEAYIHRSGRTGRAGESGVAVMLYEPRKSNFSRIERESGVKFEHISAPQPADIAKTAGAEAADKINEISDSVVPVYKAAAEELLNSSYLSAVDLLAKAAGYIEIKTRSLLISMENYVTVKLECGKPVSTQSFAYGVLRRFLPEHIVESIKDVAVTADGRGAVFDVAANDLDTFLEVDLRAQVMELGPPKWLRQNVAQLLFALDENDIIKPSPEYFQTK